MGYVDFYTFLIPLYGLSLGLDASEIGILVGARSIFALLLLSQAVRGWLEGVIQPVILSVQARVGRSPSTGCGRGTASDWAAAHLDPDPTAGGLDRGPPGSERELCHFRRIRDAVDHTACADHPLRRALDSDAEERAHAGRLTFTCENGILTYSPPFTGEQVR
jgi:hypothetical protein